MQKLTAPQVVGIGFDVVGRGVRDRLLLLRQQLDLQLLDDCMRDLVLNRENVSQVSVVAVGPDMATVLAVDQLPRHPHS